MKTELNLCPHWEGNRPCTNFQALFRNSAVSMLLLDPQDGTIREANETAIQFYGYPREELKGMKIGQINRLSEAEIKQQLKAAKEGKIQDLAFRHRLANGEIREVEVNTGPIDVLEERLVFSIVRDITRRNRAERALKARSKVHMAIMLADGEQGILAETCQILVNEAGYQMAWIGYALNDPEKRIEPQVSAGRAQTAMENAFYSWGLESPLGHGPCGRAVRSGKPELSADISTDPDYSPWRESLQAIQVESVLALPLKTDVRTFGVLVIGAMNRQAFTEDEIDLLQGLADGVAHGVEALRGRDKQKRLEQRLTWERNDLMRAQKELQESNARLVQAQNQMVVQEKLASVGQLAAGVAHEINNPTGFITSNLGSLRKYLRRIRDFLQEEQAIVQKFVPSDDREELDRLRKKLKIDFLLEDIEELIDESTDGADRIRAIVQNLKTFARTDSEELDEANLNECMESTITIAWNEVKYKADLVKEYGELPPLRCNAQKLNQVFMNLLVNAAHAIEEHGTIRVRTWAEEKEICVSIADDGCGISPENQHRIFEPFFTTKTVGKGTGLGMSIVLEIVKKHDGEIDLQSEEGKGTTFTIRLPRNDGAEEAETTVL